MTNEIVNTPAIFTNEKFGSVRVVMRDGEPWFVAKDVAEKLGYADPSRAVVQHCKKSIKSTILANRTDGNPPLNISLIPESDVYRLVMRSNLPGAEEFQTWVCEEVLPSIRKTGQYSITQSAPALPNFSNPAEAARAWADEYEAKQKALALVEEQKATIEAQEIALGNNRDWKAVTAIPWLKEYFSDTSSRACSRIGKTLTALSRYQGMEIRKAEDDRWGMVNVYHQDVIASFKMILDRNSSVLADLRK